MRRFAVTCRPCFVLLAQTIPSEIVKGIVHLYYVKYEPCSLMTSINLSVGAVTLNPIYFAYWIFKSRFSASVLKRLL